MSIIDGKVVVKGEASESDEEFENENVRYDNKIKNNKNKKGLAIEGEASESDEDIISYCKEATEKIDRSPGTSRRYSESFYRTQNSILQRKLMETNASLWKNLTQFIQNSVLSASRDLLSADQLLLKSQVSLQTSSHNLKIANNTSRQVFEKTKDVVTANFIPNIKI